MDLHGDPGVIQRLLYEAAALYPPVFAEVLLSTSVRTKHHRVAHTDQSCTCSGSDEPGPAGVRAVWTDEQL